MCTNYRAGMRDILQYAQFIPDTQPYIAYIERVAPHSDLDKPVLGFILTRTHWTPLVGQDTFGRVHPHVVDGLTAAWDEIWGKFYELASRAERKEMVPFVQARACDSLIPLFRGSTFTLSRAGLRLVCIQYAFAMLRAFVRYRHVVYHSATSPQRAVVDAVGGFSRHMRMVVDGYCAGVEMWWIVDSVPPTARHLELDEYPRVWEGYQMEWSELIDSELLATPLIKLPFAGTIDDHYRRTQQGVSKRTCSRSPPRSAHAQYRHADIKAQTPSPHPSHLRHVKDQFSSWDPSRQPKLNKWHGPLTQAQMSAYELIDFTLGRQISRAQDIYHPVPQHLFTCAPMFDLPPIHCFSGGDDKMGILVMNWLAACEFVYGRIAERFGGMEVGKWRALLQGQLHRNTAAPLPPPESAHQNRRPSRTVAIPTWVASGAPPADHDSPDLALHLYRLVEGLGESCASASESLTLEQHQEVWTLLATFARGECTFLSLERALAVLLGDTFDTQEPWATALTIVADMPAGETATELALRLDVLKLLMSACKSILICSARCRC